jgi:hypothetical protein
MVAAAVAVSFVLGLFVGVRLGQPSFRLSPAGTAETTVGGVHLEIAYSRPYARGRVVLGELVPFDEVWRTGANEATSLVVDGRLVIGDTPVPAGAYTLYTIPGRSSWTLIVNRETGQWGTTYDEERDLARVPMRRVTLEQPVEQLTIRFEPSSEPTGADALLVIEWETTRAEVEVRAG